MTDEPIATTPDASLEDAIAGPSVPAGPALAGRPMESRASITFSVLALLGLIVAVVVGGSPRSSTQAVLVHWIELAAVVALAVIYGLEARGLARRRPWAVAAAPALLVLVIATGLITVLLNLGQGTVTIPIDVVLASWSLLGRRAVAAPSVRDPRVAVIIAATIVAVLGATAAQPVLGSGGLLDVHQGDLSARLDASCGPSGGGAPEVLDVTYRWSWTRTSLLRDGSDAVVIGWTGYDADGQPLYSPGDPEPAGPGIQSGLRDDDPNGFVARAVANAQGPSWTWGIDLSTQQLASGEIHVRLLRARPDGATGPGAPAGPLLIQATYVHLGSWDQQVQAECGW